MYSFKSAAVHDQYSKASSEMERHTLYVGSSIDLSYLSKPYSNM